MIASVCMSVLLPRDQLSCCFPKKGQGNVLLVFCGAWFCSHPWVNCLTSLKSTLRVKIFISQKFSKAKCKYNVVIEQDGLLKCFDHWLCHQYGAIWLVQFMPCCLNSFILSLLDFGKILKYLLLSLLDFGKILKYLLLFRSLFSTFTK